MPKEIGEVVRAVARLWIDAGKNVSAEELRKWMQPHVETLDAVLGDKSSVELLKKLVTDAFPDGEWQGPVALNQIIYIGKLGEDPSRAKDLLSAFLSVWEKQPVNLSAIIVAWRKEVIRSRVDPLVVLETLSFDPSRPSYFSPEMSARSEDFFLNVLKDEMGVDVDELTDAVEKIVGSEHVGTFFRLVDVDAPLAPEAFVERVERAVEVLAAAKEQGVDVSEILKKWDELADQGGERFEKLAEAVKLVGTKAVVDDFRKRLADACAREKIPIISSGKEDVSNLLAKLHSLGLVQIRGKEVVLEKDVSTLIQGAFEALVKASPAAVYVLDDIVKVLQLITDGAETKAGAVALAKLLIAADVDTVKTLLANGEILRATAQVLESSVKSGIAPEDVAKAVKLVLKEGAPKADAFIQVVYEKLRKVKE